MKLLIAYDGTLDAKTALRYGLKKLREDGGSAAVLNLFHSAMFVDYGAGPAAEDMARAEAKRRAEEAKSIIADEGAGLWVRMSEAEGEPEDEIVSLAAEGFDAVLAPPKYKSIMKESPCPVILVPGTILVPVDNTEITAPALARITDEARATGSKVVVMGIVPVHMYGPSEEAELERVEHETSAALAGAARALKAEGVEVAEAMRSGYPDEEILRGMEEFTASMLIIPQAEDRPSELSKAASIINEESERLKRPVLMDVGGGLHPAKSI